MELRRADPALSIERARHQPTSAHAPGPSPRHQQSPNQPIQFARAGASSTLAERLGHGNDGIGTAVPAGQPSQTHVGNQPTAQTAREAQARFLAETFSTFLQALANQILDGNGGTVHPSQGTADQAQPQTVSQPQGSVLSSPESAATSTGNAANDVLANFNPTGASHATARQDGLSGGLDASRQMAATDEQRVMQYADRFEAAAAKYDLPPALLAAIASRETRGGNVLDNGWGDHGNGYGLMQVDRRYHDVQGLGDPASQEHIDQAASILRGFYDQCRAEHPSWSHEQCLQAAVSAYNGGPDQFTRGDEGTTGGDYSNDVLARAQYYAERWPEGGVGDSPSPTEGAPPAQPSPGAGTPPPSGPSTHTVQPGDTLSEIAERHGVALAELIAANPQISNPDLIFPGQEIHLPGGATAPSDGPAPSSPPPGTGATPSPSVNGEPSWMAIARGELGQSEISGSGPANNNDRISDYHGTTTLGRHEDETPWCSSYVNWVMEQAGIPGTDNALARSWADWGVESDYQPGAVVTFDGNQDGVIDHVGLFAGFAENGNLLILGGNQSNEVNIAQFDPSTAVTVRMPPGS